ncbi:MAG: hypothetical protein K8R18_11555 [Parvibaculum sp.]|uniref:hypothetical protein n=1 Tax=Parvibaculum sp. TaxID=2024848 RepID=UPI0025D3F219|nr:hypothetical protein [Parvibaculum sp.]MCE9650246.1 hypothetical protein [Parvibaculum sp.]
MTIFAIIAPAPLPALNNKIAGEFPNDFFKINDTQWLISATGTAQEISNKIGVTDGQTGSAIIFATSGYYGRAPANIWEWIKAKLEAPASG